MKRQKQPIATDPQSFQILQLIRFGFKITNYYVQKVNDNMEHFTIELETVRKDQMGILELKITVSEIKNSIDEVNSHCITADERINEVEDRLVEIIIIKRKLNKNVREKERAGSCGKVIMYV